MKIIEAKHFDDMSLKAAQFMIEKVQRDPTITLGLATGGTPQKMYELLINDHRINGTSYHQVTTFNLDEYIGLDRHDPNSYYTYMHKALFDHIDIRDEQAFLPNGTASNLNAECERYEALIRQHGGIDLQVLGIGANGHIGFNEPGTSFESSTHIVKLTESTREANARYFNDLSEVPTEAITMGIQSIMNAKEILLLASGKKKADALYQLIHGKVDESFPASVLQRHEQVTIIADREALQKVAVSSN
ncbi:glucosamine-6-phosphate deaminase [Halalkalibacterium halodurans]|uniref:glucosamine-6-phosphate deaminase n=1 Tax=Halalkalibacterium halodurans TaxID=86665 RepID=UPI001067E00C|nr:glucosamine-6-phosphate deaminase [Halalkalibacterium halodurans]MED3645743.1 glucosamine-6-phosphate deaminase [Halalkalibacterium halodurans]TES51775.1 glucosamine-6-phosphate deaminase [Halalkalibacterium halodurans]